MRKIAELVFTVWHRRTLLEKLALAGIVAGLAAAALIQNPMEPRYGGHCLSFWVAELDRESNDESREAISAMGTPAAAALLSRLESTNWPTPPTQNAPFWDRWSYEFRFTQIHMRRARALDALKSLGPNAKSALPFLIARQNDPVLGENFLLATEAIEADPIKTYRRACRTGHRGMRFIAARRMAEIKSTAATNMLLQLTMDTDYQVRRQAIQSALEMTFDPKTRQNLLQQGLSDRHWTVQQAVLQFLGESHNEIWLVLPEIRALTNDVKCRVSALSTLAVAGLMNEKTVISAMQEEQAARRKMVQVRFKDR